MMRIVEQRGWPTRIMHFLKIALIALAVVGCIAAGSYLLVDGTMIGSKREIAEVILIVALPVALYAAIKRPFIFPFCLYVLVAPFDSLLRINHSIGTVTKLVALCAGAAFLFWLARNRRFVKPPPVTMVWLGLLVWMALSIFWAPDSAEAISKVTTYTLLIVLYVVISVMPVNEGDYSAVLWAIVISGIVGAAASVYLYRSGAFVQHAQIQGVLSSRLMVRFGDNKLDPNEFSAAFLLPAAVALTWALQRSWSLGKLVFIAIFLVIIGGILVNDSRGTLLAFAVLIGYMILRGRFKAQLVSVVILALGGSLFMRTSPWARFSGALSNGGAGRLDIWKVGFESFKHHWFAGSGIGSFPLAYDQSFISVYQTYFANWDRAPHSIVVEYAVELGVVGLALLFSAYYLQMRSLGMIGHSSRLFDIRIAVEGALLALFVAGLFVDTMVFKYTWLTFGVIALTRSMALMNTSAMESRSSVQLRPMETSQLNPKVPINA